MNSGDFINLFRDAAAQSDNFDSSSESNDDSDADDDGED